MRRSLALATAAAIVAGLGVAAYAEAPTIHVVRIALPDGGTETVRYTGDVASDPAALARSGMAFDPFAGFDRIAAAMDAQAATMMQQVAAMTAPATPGGDRPLAALAGEPAGARYRTVTSTTVDGHTCTTSVEGVSMGAGQAPRLIRTASGDGCGAVAHAPAGAIPAVAPTPPTPPIAPQPVAAPKPPAAPAPAANTI